MPEEHDTESVATETVGDLIKRLGEREAYIHIVTYNIKLRMAVAAYLCAWDDHNYLLLEAIEGLRDALHNDGF